MLTDPKSQAVTTTTVVLKSVAIIHQNWPEKYALTDNAPVEKLIEDRVQIMSDGMFSSSRGKDNH